MRSVEEMMDAENARELEDTPQLRAVPEQLRVVCFGGGTGMPVLLRGLRRFTLPRADSPQVQLTAVVTMADDGGSSGRLRRELGLPPPGDVRNCLVALAAPSKRGLAELFQFRFRKGRGLSGHTVGNLMLGALAELRGDFLEAVRVAGVLLDARGRVLPSTLRRVELVADLGDGQRVVGEREISRTDGKIRRLSLSPAQPPAAPGVISAIEHADLIVLGPGSLYSSILPNLLVGGVAEAMARSPALKVLALNLMTQPGETDGYAALDHVQVLLDHVGPVVDCVLAHSGEHRPLQLQRYARRNSAPVKADIAALERLGVHVVRGELAAGGARIRHHPLRLANWIVRLAKLKRAVDAQRQEK